MSSHMLSRCCKHKCAGLASSHIVALKANKDCKHEDAQLATASSKHLCQWLSSSGRPLILQASQKVSQTWPSTVFKSLKDRGPLMVLVAGKVRNILAALDVSCKPCQVHRFLSSQHCPQLRSLAGASSIPSNVHSRCRTMLHGDKASAVQKDQSCGAVKML